MARSPISEAAPILIVGGDKGGVGKSFTARTLAGWLLQGGADVLCVDGDSRNAHLDRFYADRLTVHRVNLRDRSGWSGMVDAWAAARSGQVLLVDTPAGAGEQLPDQWRGVSEAARRLGRPVFLIWVASASEDSVRLFRSCMAVNPPARTLFLMNRTFGRTEEDFRIWRNSNLRQQALAAGIGEMTLPELSAAALRRIDEAHAPFFPKSDIAFSLSEAIDFDFWWTDVAEALRPLERLMQEAAR